MPTVTADCDDDPSASYHRGNHMSFKTGAPAAALALAVGALASGCSAHVQIGGNSISAANIERKRPLR